MSNVRIYAGLANGDLMPIVEEKSSDQIVLGFVGDDTGPPVRSLTIEVITESGAKVRINVPNSSANASVSIDGKII